MLAEAAANAADRTQILGAIERASQATGADFHYLLNTAIRESSLKPSAQASTSSAAGLFQFVEQTWLGMIKNCGAKYGLGSYADAISQGANGRYRTATPADRTAILALRNNPEIASLMEGEYAQASRASLQQALGRNVCGGELYAAHFLGTDAACRLIRLSDSSPGINAASAFPAAASANRSVFFHANGTAKTVREVYNWAVNQPNADMTPAPTLALAPASAPVTVSDSIVGAPDDNALLASFASWRPTHRFFSGEPAASSSTLPPTPFLMTSGVMDVLSSLRPVAADNGTD